MCMVDYLLTSKFMMKINKLSKPPRRDVFLKRVTPPQKQEGVLTGGDSSICVTTPENLPVGRDRGGDSDTDGPEPVET